MGVTFDGTDDYLGTTTAGALIIAGTAEFTICGWFRTTELTAPSQGQGIFAMLRLSGNNDEIRFSMSATAGRLQMFARWNSAGANDIHTTEDSEHLWNDGGWHHFAIRRSGDDLEWFLDGELEVGMDMSTSGSFNSIDQVFFGRQRTTSGATPFDGELAEWFGYDSALTNDDIAAHFNSGVAPTSGLSIVTETPVWYYPFTADADDADATDGPFDLTETSAPVYDDHTTGESKIGTTPHILTLGSHYDTGVISTSSAWTKDFIVPATGRIGVGVVYQNQGSGNDEGDTVLITAGNGYIRQSLVLDDSNIIGSGNTERSEDGVTVDVTGSSSRRIRVTVTPSTGTPTIRGVVVRASDAESGCVQNYGNHLYSGPSACVYNGNSYKTHFELYSGDLYLSKNGVSLGKIASQYAGERNDYVHYGSFVLPMAAGIVVGHWGHNTPQPRVFYYPSGDPTHPNVRTHTLASGNWSYCRGVVLQNSPHTGEVLILSRGTGAPNSVDHRPASVIRIDDVTSASPTITYDVIFDNTKWRYPIEFQRLVTSSGQELVGACWNFLSNPYLAFEGAAVAIFDPAANSGVGKWYLTDKTEAANNSALGTTTTRRFSDTQAANKISDGTPGVRITYSVAGAGNDEHVLPDGAALMDAWDWDSSGAAVLHYYSESPNGPDVFEAKTHRWVMQKAGTRYLGATPDFSIPTITAHNSDRIFLAMRWKHDNPASRIAIVAFMERGTRKVPGLYDLNEENDPNPPISIEPYFDWGAAESILIYQVVDPMSTSMAWTLLDTAKLPPRYVSGFLKIVAGSHRQFTYDSAINILHQAHHQAVTRSAYSPVTEAPRQRGRLVGV